MALKRGGVAIDDPIAWFDSLSDECVQFWSDYWKVEPWGMEWERHSQMMSMLDVVYSATINPHLSKHDRAIPRPPIDFMPVDYYRPKVPKKNKIANITAQLEQYVRSCG